MEHDSGFYWKSISVGRRCHIDDKTLPQNKLKTKVLCHPDMKKGMNHYDQDIPVAVATPQYDGYSQSPPPTLTKGRSSRVVIPSESVSPLGEYEIGTLKEQGFPAGLIDSMVMSSRAFPLRIWVVDNSGSMNTGDGHRIVESRKANVVKFVQCSRWSELQQTVEYHARISGLIKAPTVFRLLNDPGSIVGPQQFSIAERGPDLIQDDIHMAMSTMTRASPSGCTPLSDHIREIRANIMEMLPQLQSSGQKVAIILATDGLPTDQFGRSSAEVRRDFETDLRSLVGLPVWIVVRLCTDEDSVVDYYNNLDSQLELELDILDDWVGESKEVHDSNPWLTYGICLHRMREMGFHHRLFDLLDERRFTLDEVREFLYLLLGPARLDGIPDPNIDLDGFLRQVRHAVDHEDKQWNPVLKKMTPWIDVKKLKQCYGEGCVLM